MLIKFCDYNPLTDVSEVDQFGYVNLCDAYVNHSIAGDLSVEELEFNDIEDPATIIGKPRDVFDAIEMGASISNNPAAYKTADEKSE